MTGAVWHGRHGAVALGPTQDRVARYLDDLARHGWIHIRTDELAERLRLERSEAYRIVARLRELGLFGASSDRGGHAGGRRVWRTAIRHEGGSLDPARHRVAWSRIRGVARAIRTRTRARIATINAGGTGLSPARPSVASRAATEGRTFAQLMRDAGLGSLMDQWGVT